MKELKHQKEIFFFDMDGLLFDTEKLYYETRYQVLSKYGYSYSMKEHIRYIGRGFDDTVYKLQKLTGDKKLGQKIFNESMALFQLAIEKGHLSLKKGALDFLTELNEKGKKCYITTSSSKKVAMRVLQIAKIEDFFCEIISGEEVCSNKPAPDIYLRALTIAQANKEETVVFEDAKSGVEAAIQAGINVIMIPDWVTPDEEDKRRTIAVAPSLYEAAALFH
ncbi:HAD family hydrolase [Tetragenococcus halophilus]|uniref:HAD family hydrolase n=1 Tax=Tetragenococcus halophilus TaxID=51669 RepID=UPI00077C23B8|nr:HAD family phosphatase [Tetragenococcus halophilus]